MKGRKLTGENSGNNFYASLYGTSMNPTLSEVDVLEVVPYRRSPVRVGDVIFFNPPDTGQFVMHRVVRITSKGILARGDNCVSDDPWFLQADNVKGHVVAAWRGQKRRKIIGGRTGLLMAYLIRLRRTIDKNLSRFCRPIYLFLSQKGGLQLLLPERLKPRVVSFRVNEGNCRRLLFGNYVVGRYEERRRRWVIKRPFRLFLDEAVLSEKKL